MAQYSTQQIQDMIRAAAAKYNIPADVALAVAQHESNFNPTAVSPTNPNGTKDYGVMQLNSATLQQNGLTPDQALDPAVNIDIGVRMLGQYYGQYGGDLPSVLGAYNAGPGAVSSGNLPSNYISSVMNILGPSAGFPSGSDTSGTDSTYMTPAEVSTGGTVNILGTDVPIVAVAGGGLGLLFLAWFAFKD